MKNFKNKGFTLIELLLVIAIVTLLSSIFVFNSTEAKKKAEDAHMVEETRQVETSVLLYREDHNGFVPHDISVNSTGGIYLEGSSDYENNLRPLVPKYFPSVPHSPDGKSYAYGVSTDRKSAIFIANLKTQKTNSGSSSVNKCSIINQSSSENSCIKPQEVATFRPLVIPSKIDNINCTYSVDYPSSEYYCVDNNGLFNAKFNSKKCSCTNGVVKSSDIASMPDEVCNYLYEDLESCTLYSTNEDSPNRYFEIFWNRSYPSDYSSYLQQLQQYESDYQNWQTCVQNTPTSTVCSDISADHCVCIE